MTGRSVFGRILCSTDFSPTSEIALRHAGELASRTSARLAVIAVNEVLLTAAARVEFDESYLQRSTEDELATFVGRVLGTAGDVELIVRTGDPATTIVQTAGEHGADLISLGTHGRSGLKKVLFGSVTEAVLRRSQTPVLVSPPTNPAEGAITLATIQVMVVPVDFNEHSLDQIKFSAKLTTLSSAKLVIAHVVRISQGLAYLTPYLEAHHRVMHAEAVDQLNRLSLELGPDHRIETLVREGDPAEEIVALAKERHAQLVVMGLAEQ